MSDSASMYPILNRLMKFVLRSPLHGPVSKNILLITFTGRTSGKTYTTPVSYAQRDGQVLIFTHANWWKNLRGGAPVTLRLRGRGVQGMAEAVAEDKDAIATELAAHLKNSPFDAKFYNVTFDDDGNPEEDKIRQAVQTVVMIRVQLDKFIP
jgi:deazaflavin-dependent oxidoreductase (nitroreductase family)